MAEWIRLEELFEDPTRWPNPEKLYVDYTPNYGKIALSSDDTGSRNGDQEMETQILPMQPHLTENGTAILIAAHPTTQKFKIYGANGYENIDKLLQEIGRTCYSSDDLDAQGGCITPQIFEELSEWHQQCGVYREHAYHQKYFLGADKEAQGNYRYVQICYLWKLQSKFIAEGRQGTYIEASVRPYAEFFSGILVNVESEEFDGSEPARALKVKLADVSQYTGQELISRLTADVRHLRQENRRLKNEVRLLHEQIEKLPKEIERRAYLNSPEFRHRLLTPNGYHEI